MAKGPPLDFDIRGQDESGAAFASARRNADRTEAHMQRFAGRASSGMSRRFRGAFQQVGFQVADVATQLQLGTNALQVFSIQGAQLLGFFGPFGAAAGAAAAILGGVAGALWQTDDAGDAAGDTLEKLTGVMERLRGVAEPTRDALRASARNLVGQIRDELGRARSELDRLQSESDAGGIGVLGAASFDTSAVSRAQEEVKRLSQELLIARAEAGEFGDRFSVAAKDAEKALAAARQQDKTAAREAAAAQRESDRMAKNWLTTTHSNVEALKAAEARARSFGESIGDAFSRAIVDGEKLSDVAKGLLQSFARAGINSFFGNAFSGFGSFFGGPRAMGGPVSPGKAYLVGERGPELFAPRSAGTIVPNGGMRGGGSSGPVNINVTVNGARGNAEIRDMVAAGVSAGMAQVPDIAVKAVRSNTLYRPATA